MSTFYLNQQTQPTPNTCACTCLAMILNEPVPWVVKQFHERYYRGNTRLDTIMDGLYLEYEVPSPFCRRPMAEYAPGAYLLSVPSLRTRGGFHYILLEMAEDARQYRILDPNIGRDVPFYTTPDDDREHAVPLVSWEVHAFFPLASLKARALH